MLPDAFYAIDGVLETFLTILNNMKVYGTVVQREAAHYMPFLLTTTVMMEAVKLGVGRETAHGIIKKHAVATSNDWREGKIVTNDLFTRLEQDGGLKLTKAQFDSILAVGSKEIGAAGRQVDTFVRTADLWIARFPAAAAIQPGRML